MRKIGLIVATTVASVSVASVAQAIDVNQGLSIATVGKKGTKAKPAGIKLTTTTSTTAKDGTSDGTYATKKAVIHFDKNLVFNPKSFPICSNQTVVTNFTKCPKGSQVGTGGAMATVGPDKIQQHPTIRAFNGANNTLILKLIHKEGELDSDFVLTGTLKKDTGKFGVKLDVPIPAPLQQPAKNFYITLNEFKVAIANQKAKGKYYAASTGCTGGKYQFSGDFSFTDGSKATAKDTSKC